MKHHDSCKSWASFHPYDCPECKILNDYTAEFGEMYTFEQLEEYRDEAYQEGRRDGEDDNEWEINEAAEAAFDEGIQSVLENPEKYNLYSEAQWKAKYADH